MKKRFNIAVLVGLTSALPYVSAQASDSPSAPATTSAALSAPETPAVAATPVAPAAPASIREVAPASDLPESPALAQGATATPAATAPVVKSKETLTVDFPDDDIRNILRNVADLFDLNLVIPETLQGKTSIKLREVTWRQIFKVVLNPVGYTYVEDGNIIRIVTSDSLNQEPAVTEIFVLNYAKASDVKPGIDNLVDTKIGGKIVVDARSNSLIVSERPSMLGRIRPIINQLDRPTDQVMIETKFIDVTDGDTKDLGVNWASLQRYGVGTESKLKKEFGNEVRGETSAKNLDEGFLAESKAKLDRITGDDVSAVPYTRNATTGEVTYAAGGSSLLTNTFKRTTTAVLNADQFNIILSALNTLNKSKLISNPTIVTLNNTEATINIGREYPIPNYTYNQERGVFEVSGFNYKPIGVILKVTPQVNAAGFIRLSVEPEVSSSNENVSFGGSGGASIPIIQVRKTKTQITLKDGYTLGIGGLVESSSSDSRTKVPLLGDIPGLGKLFQSKSKTKSDHNLLVFITAKTVKPDGASTGEIFDPRVTRQMELQEADLPGFRDGSNPYFTPTPVPEKK